ncbi:NAD(P)-binding domain-containing protein, partial [Salmonella enterica subsp. enterica serovar Istanbul]|nr:NAD(P)-binding domain-containing protein [Salmonella enterica subsp. enterica serovar Istanbul]
MRIAVIGYGAVGRATASLLLARGDEVRVVQRRQPAALA